MKEVGVIEQTQAMERTNGDDDYEIPIPSRVLENIQFPIQAPAVERVEDLGEH